MKKIILLIVWLSTAQFAQAQAPQKVNLQKPYPNSIIELGVGIGPNFGIFGGQMVIGYKGCGVLGALGFLDGVTCYAIGGQISYEWFYFNLSWATVGEYTHHVNMGYGVSYETSDPVNGLVFMMGGKINLLKAKTLYLQLGVGYKVASVHDYPFGDIDFSGVTVAAGIGYRIAFKKPATTPNTRSSSDNGF